MSTEWQGDRAKLDRRVTVNEKVSEDCIERLKLSGSLIDNYFLTSPDIRKFQRTTEWVDTLQGEMKALKTETRDTSSALLRIQANHTTKDDLLEVRQRVMSLEPTVTDKLPEFFESTKKLLDYSMAHTDRLAQLETANTHTTTVVQSMTTRVNAMEASTLEIHGASVTNREENKLTSSRLATQDAHTTSELKSMRDLAGSLSSRLMTAEGKIALNAKLNSADLTSKFYPVYPSPLYPLYPSIPVNHTLQVSQT